MFFKKIQKNTILGAFLKEILKFPLNQMSLGFGNNDFKRHLVVVGDFTDEKVKGGTCKLDRFAGCLPPPQHTGQLFFKI